MAGSHPPVKAEILDLQKKERLKLICNVSHGQLIIMFVNNRRSHFCKALIWQSTTQSTLLWVVLFLQLYQFFLPDTPASKRKQPQTDT